MNKPQIKKYRGFELHVVNGQWKYDIYKHGIWYSSVNTLKEAKEYIKSVIWTRENIPQ